MDPGLAQVISSKLISITFEMSVTMERASYTTIFSEFKDHSCAICDEKLRMAATSASDFGCPMHTGGMPLSLQAVVDFIGLENLKPGDIICSNDVGMGGTHLPDFQMAKPIFYDGELVAFCLTRGHHLDTGGATPGSAIPDATSIYAEGLSVPPVRLYKEGVLDRDLFELILRNVRLKEQRGDFEAMIASVKRGGISLLDLIKKYGVKAFKAAERWANDYSERRFRAKIDELPDGEYESESYGEHDGLEDRDYLINLKLIVEGSNLILDFTGSDVQAPGSTNCPMGSTLSAVMTGLINIIDPYVPINYGVYKPVKIIMPYGSFVNCKWPAATCSGNTETSNKIVDAVYRALIQGAPDKVPAGGANSTCSTYVYGIDPRTGNPYMFLNSPCGGWGGKKGMDGQDDINIIVGGSVTLPTIEILESKSAIFTNLWGIKQDSGGPGKWRGGAAAEWRFMIDPKYPHAAEITLIAEMRRLPAWGAFGGKPGIEQMAYIITKTGEKKVLPTKCHFYLHPGEELVINNAGGGGYGDPLERDPKLVRKDVIEQRVSIQGAKYDYGVVINPETYEIDETATEALREKLRREKCWKK